MTGDTMNGFNIEQRKREAQQRLKNQTDALDTAKRNLAATVEDIEALEQEEAEEAAKEARAASAADGPRLYTLSLTKRQVLDAIHLLGWNVTIPDALRKVDYAAAAKAYDTLKNLQQPLIQQFKEYTGENALFKK